MHNSIVRFAYGLGSKVGCSIGSVALALGGSYLSSQNAQAWSFEKGPIPAFYRSGEIATLCAQAMTTMQKQLDYIAAFNPEIKSIDATLLAFEAAKAEFSDATSPLTFMASVSTNPEIREEAQACEEKISEFSVNFYARRDLYQAIKDQTPRNALEKRLLTETVDAFEKNGLKLSDAALAEVTRLQKELALKEVQFANHLNQDMTKVELTLEELAGVPQSYINSLTRTPSGNYWLTTKESDASLFLENASNSEARKKWSLAFYNRGGAENTALLQEAIVLRSKIAGLMGYATWADYRIQGRMAKDKDTVLSFLHGLKSTLAARSQEDLNRLLDFKKSLGQGTSVLNPWDVGYLMNQYKKQNFSLDQELIREYFPTDTVMSGMFAVYSKLFGVRFEEVKDASVWAENVHLYGIYDQVTPQAPAIGFFYTDLFPREGKYDHAAAFTLLQGHQQSTGQYTRPVSAIVANLSPPLDGKPSLLDHGDVETLFHEFGHIMHQTLTRAPYGSMAGSSVAQDFVEAPSQMLENWVWDAEIVQQISGHYLDPSKKLPDAMLTQMLAARDFMQGYRYTRQLMLALYDMTLATQPAADVTTTYDQLYTELTGLTPIEGWHFPASFGHLMGGYDGGYYGYLWSEVYAADMFSQFAAGGLLNAEIGHRYRRTILELGDTLTGFELLEKFLGRAPNSDAFFQKLGLGDH